MIGYDSVSRHASIEIMYWFIKMRFFTSNKKNPLYRNVYCIKIVEDYNPGMGRAQNESKYQMNVQLIIFGHFSLDVISSALCYPIHSHPSQNITLDIPFPLSFRISTFSNLKPK